MTDHTKLIARLEQEALNCERYAEEGERGDWDGIASLLREAIAALTADRAAESHRCSGCSHRWDGPLKGVELCGDCWRKAQPVVHQAAEPTAPAERERIARELVAAVMAMANGLMCDRDCYCGCHDGWPRVNAAIDAAAHGGSSDQSRENQETARGS